MAGRSSGLPWPSRKQRRNSSEAGAALPQRLRCRHVRSDRLALKQAAVTLELEAATVDEVDADVGDVNEQVAGIEVHGQCAVGGEESERIEKIQTQPDQVLAVPVRAVARELQRTAEKRAQAHSRLVPHRIPAPAEAGCLQRQQRPGQVRMGSELRVLRHGSDLIFEADAARGVVQDGGVVDLGEHIAAASNGMDTALATVGDFASQGFGVPVIVHHRDDAAGRHGWGG